MAGIFVSYRRSGASTVTYRLVDELKREFGEESIFLDQESIDPGLPFAEAIQKSLRQCSVALVIIGPKWLTMQNAEGLRRLDDPNDWVRQEVKLAMDSKVRVIPILVQGADMPEPDELPEVIRGMAALQAFPISDSQAHWSFDVSRLSEKLASIDPKLTRNTTKNEVVSKPHFSYKVIAALVIWLLVSLTTISEGSADSDVMLGAVMFLIAALALSIFGFKDIRAGKTRGKISSIISMVLCGLAVLGTSLNLISYGLYDDYGTYDDGYVDYDQGYVDYSKEVPSTDTYDSYDSYAEPEPAKSVPATNYVSIAGSWVSPEGMSYQITQMGNAVTFTEYNVFGAQVGQGNGSLNSNVLTFNYYNSFVGLSTTGTATVSGNAMSIALLDPTTGQSLIYAAYRQ